MAQLADLPKVSSLSVTNEIELEIGVYKFVFCLKLVGQAMVDNPS